MNFTKGDDNNQDLVVSDDKYLNTIVSFWEIMPGDKKELLCLGASIGLYIILVLKGCHDLLDESNNTVICTGSSYFDDNYMNFIIESTQEIHAFSKFIIVIINVKIDPSSSLPIDYIDLKEGKKYPGVLVGWSEKKGQPMIEQSTFIFRGRRMRIVEENNHLSAKDFPLGSLAVINGRIMAASSIDIYMKTQFYRILSEDQKVLSKVISDWSIDYAYECWQSGIELKRTTAIMPEDYTNILVSLWKMISEEEYYILCLGALIKSNLIFTTTQCYDKLGSLSEVGVLTGMNDVTDHPEKILHSKQPFREKSNFITLVLEREIDLTSSIRIGVVTTSIDETDTDGVLLGWNKQTNRMKSPFSFKNKERFLSLDGIENHCDGDFPEGSIAIKGRNIIGFTYLDAENNANQESNVTGIRTVDEKKILISKIFYEDFTKVNSLLQKDFYDDIVLTDDDYFNFVVSLWEHKNSGRYDMLCLGALIKSNWILMNIDCFEKVVERPLDKIGIQTYSMFRKQVPPRTEVIDHSRIIRDKTATSNYMVLFLNSDFEVLSRIKADWVKLDKAEDDDGILVGWQKEKGPVKQKFHPSCKLRLRIPISDIKDFASDYPLGSLIIMGHKLRASVYMEARLKIEQRNGIIHTVKSRSNKSILAYKFMGKDSSKIRSMLTAATMSMTKRQRICEKDYSPNHSSS